MMTSKSLVAFYCAKSFSKKKLIYSLSSLFLVLFLLHMITNEKQINNNHYTTHSDVERNYRKKFNLMDRPAEVGEECNLDYINIQKLEQDHPCVLKLIRLMYLDPPSAREVLYNLTPTADTSGEYEAVGDAFYILKEKKEGFFVECGAFDGLFHSNTLELEMNHTWTGLLIEASPLTYKQLKTRNRKSWKSNVCLSLAPYPTKSSFTNPRNASGVTPAIFRVVETDEKGNKIYDHAHDEIFGIPNMETTEIQCFPFYSILLALNQTTVDYFSLDIEGHEKRVLETIPWKRLDIKTMKIEMAHIPPDGNNKNGSEQLRELLEGESGYINIKPLLPWDEFYIKNYL